MVERPSHPLERLHAPRLSICLHSGPRPLRRVRLRLRQGQRHDRHGARAAGARSDQRAGGGDRRSDALQHLRGTDEDQRGLLGHAAAGRKVGLLARSQDPDLHPQAERQVPGRRALLLEGRQISRSSGSRRRTRPTRTRGSSPSIEFDRDARPDDGGAQVQGPKLRGAVSPRHGYGGHPRREKRRRRSDQPGRHRTLQALLVDQGLLAHARQVGRLPRRGEDPANARYVPLHLRSLRCGRRDARRRRRRVPALRQCRGARPVQERSALPGSGRRHRGQDDPRDEQQEEAARRSQGAAGDRLCDRPQGDHRRRAWTASERRSAAI